MCAFAATAQLAEHATHVEVLSSLSCGPSLHPPLSYPIPATSQAVLSIKL